MSLRRPRRVANGHKELTPRSAILNRYTVLGFWQLTPLQQKEASSGLAPI